MPGAHEFGRFRFCDRWIDRDAAHVYARIRSTARHKVVACELIGDKIAVEAGHRPEGVRREIADDTVDWLGQSAVLFEAQK
jgi:hypothetical protein